MTYTSLSKDDIDELFNDTHIDTNMISQPIIELLQWSTTANEPYTRGKFSLYGFDISQCYLYKKQTHFVVHRSYNSIEFYNLDDIPTTYEKRYNFHVGKRDYHIIPIINILWLDVLLTGDKIQIMQKIRNMQLMCCDNFALLYNKCGASSQLTLHSNIRLQIIYNNLIHKLNIIQRLKHIEINISQSLATLIRSIVLNGLCVRLCLFDIDKSRHLRVINEIVGHYLYNFYRIMKHVLINDILIKVFNNFYELRHNYVLSILKSWHDSIPWKHPHITSLIY